MAAGPTRPPANLEEFLWNIHSVLVPTPGPLAVDAFKEAYSKQLGHKCAVERFLVVGEGGLATTLKRIPHIVTLFQDNAVACLKATQPADTTKAGLIEADSAYRRELIKRSAAAKAKAAAGAKAGVGAKATAPGAAPRVAAAASAAAVAAAAVTPTAGEKRPAESPPSADAKKQKTNSDAETFAKMLIQGVVRVLQNRVKAGKGPLPLGELEEEFKALWKVPFNLQQAGEADAVTFLQKWPGKVELQHNGTQQIVQLSKKSLTKAGALPAKAAAPEDAAPAKAASAAAKPPPVAAAPAKAPAAAAPAAALVVQDPTAKNGSVVVPKQAAQAVAPVVPPKAAAAPVAAATTTVPAGATAAADASLAEAVSVLQSMKEMVRRQEAAVSAARRLCESLKQ